MTKTVLRSFQYLVVSEILISVKMILSRAKPAIAGEKNESKDSRGSAKKQIPTIEEFLSKRDYTGRQNWYICLRNTRL